MLLVEFRHRTHNTLGLHPHHPLDNRIRYPNRRLHPDPSQVQIHRQGCSTSFWRNRRTRRNNCLSNQENPGIRHRTRNTLGFHPRRQLDNRIRYPNRRLHPDPSQFQIHRQGCSNPRRRTRRTRRHSCLSNQEEYPGTLCSLSKLWLMWMCLLWLMWMWLLLAGFRHRTRNTRLFHPRRPLEHRKRYPNRYRLLRSNPNLFQIHRQWCSTSSQRTRRTLRSRCLPNLGANPGTLPPVLAL